VAVRCAAAPRWIWLRALVARTKVCATSAAGCSGERWLEDARCVSGRLVAGGESFERERRRSGRAESRRGRSQVVRKGALRAGARGAKRSLGLRVWSARRLLQREILASARLVRRPNRRRACPTIDLTMSRENRHPCGQLTTRTPLWRRPEVGFGRCRAQCAAGWVRACPGRRLR